MNTQSKVVVLFNEQSIRRIIQSIPSPKAEPFKQWLAKVGYERMQELADPAMSLGRARENWQKPGRKHRRNVKHKRAKVSFILNHY
jgi:hypothetical protein